MAHQHAWAQEQDITRPEASGRIVRIFDFEEHDTNPGEVPRFWFRDQDDPDETPTAPQGYAAFPEWNKAELAYTGDGGIAFAGIGSVRLPTQGGSTRLVLEPGVLPVFDRADYLVTARVRTDGLRHARARVTARYLDKSGNAIPRSETFSDAVISAGGWQQVAVEMPGLYNAAAYLQLELEVLQPRELARRSFSAKKIYEQDLSGSAYFDEVAVTQLPRVELSSNSAINVISQPQRPELTITVRDLAGENLAASLIVYDIHGVIIDRWSGRVSAGLTTESWIPQLSKLGWYRARLDLTSPNGFRVGGAACDFVWVPESDSSMSAPGTVGNMDRHRFGLLVNDLPEGLRPLLPELVSIAGTGNITLPVWNAALSPDRISEETQSLVPLVTKLLRGWQDVTLALDPVPDTLTKSARVGQDDAWELLYRDEALWLPYLSELLEKLGQRVNRWQIGRVGDDRTYWNPALRSQALELQNKLAAFVPGPTVVLPARADREWTAQTLFAGQETPAISLLALPDTPPSAVREMVAPWHRSVEDSTSGTPHATIVLQPYEDGYSPAATAADLAKRAIELWSAGPSDAPRTPLAMSIPEPWRFPGDLRGQPQPTANYGVWRNLVDRLSDRRVVGTFPVGDGSDAVACYILAPVPGAEEFRSGAIVAWNRSASPELAVLRANLGSGPLTVYDLFGNTSTPASVASGEGGQRTLTNVPLTDEPVFIEGIDVALVQFLASVRIDPAFLEWNVRDMEHGIELSNPWPFAISGKVSILEPGGYDSTKRDRSWRIQPRQLSFNVQPGQKVRLPFKVGFGPGEEAGPRDFVLEVVLNADRAYPPLEVRRPVELGLRDATMSLSTSRQGKNLNDLVVEVAIGNRSNSTLSLDLTCFAPGQPRSRTSAPDLKAGTQTIRRFIYPNAFAQLKGRGVMVTVTDDATGRRLNQTIAVE